MRQLSIGFRSENIANANGASTSTSSDEVFRRDDAEHRLSEGGQRHNDEKRDWDEREKKKKHALISVRKRGQKWSGRLFRRLHW